jgi:transposase-like protein
VRYIKGHQSRGKSASNWKGGRIKCNGYWLIFKPDHPRADKKGYVREHILKVEKKIGRYLKWYEKIHHKDKDPSNNRLSNLQLTTIWKHKSLHRKDCGQICVKCGSKDVNRNGVMDGKQTFRCNSCRANWRVNKIVGIDSDQICLNCNSRHVIRHSGVKYGKQRFQCRDCKRRWDVPLQDLKEVVPENDHRYRMTVGGK